MHIFIYNNQCFNIDNDTDASNLLQNGARELTSEEITSYGMSGFEQYVSPANTIINTDGTVTFTPPDIAKQQKEIRRQEILSELSSIDSKKIRSASAVAFAVGNGQTPNSDDMTILAKYEEESSKLREELASL